MVFSWTLICLSHFLLARSDDPAVGVNWRVKPIEFNLRIKIHDQDSSPAEKVKHSKDDHSAVRRKRRLRRTFPGYLRGETVMWAEEVSQIAHLSRLRFFVDKFFFEWKYLWHCLIVTVQPDHRLVRKVYSFKFHIFEKQGSSVFNFLQLCYCLLYENC